MKKAVSLLLVLTVAGLSFASCKFDDVKYCPNCGSTNIKEDGKEVKYGKEFQKYKCNNEYCGRSFSIIEGGVQ